MKNRYYDDDFFDYDPSPRSGSFFSTLLRLVAFAVLGLLVLSGGLWLLGAALGLVIGILTLALTLAPFLLVGWLFWVIFRAIFC